VSFFFGSVCGNIKDKFLVSDPFVNVIIATQVYEDVWIPPIDVGVQTFACQYPVRVYNIFFRTRKWSSSFASEHTLSIRH
jgi:hypothetical protein